MSYRVCLWYFVISIVCCCGILDCHGENEVTFETWGERTIDLCKENMKLFYGQNAIVRDSLITFDTQAYWNNNEGNCTCRLSYNGGLESRETLNVKFSDRICSIFDHDSHSYEANDECSYASGQHKLNVRVETDARNVDCRDLCDDDGFRVSIDVRYINVGVGEEEEYLVFGQNNELDDQYDAKVIEVTVSHIALPDDYIFTAYKSNF